jgi:glucosylceramidase
MTIDRRGFLAASTSALVLGKNRPTLTTFEPPSEAPERPLFEGIQAREIAVYTTADKTDYRLSATDKRAFKAMGQPFETQTCVFVDPTKRFQTMLGIGGALTDAAAETFAKLPPAP